MSDNTLELSISLDTPVIISIICQLIALFFLSPIFIIIMRSRRSCFKSDFFIMYKHFLGSVLVYLLLNLFDITFIILRLGVLGPSAILVYKISNYLTTIFLVATTINQFLIIVLRYFHIVVNDKIFVEYLQYLITTPLMIIPYLLSAAIPLPMMFWTFSVNNITTAITATDATPNFTQTISFFTIFVYSVLQVSAFFKLFPAAGQMSTKVRSTAGIIGLLASLSLVAFSTDLKKEVIQELPKCCHPLSSSHSSVIVSSAVTNNNKTVHTVGVSRTRMSTSTRTDK